MSQAASLELAFPAFLYSFLIPEDEGYRRSDFEECLEGPNKGKKSPIPFLLSSSSSLWGPVCGKLRNSWSKQLQDVWEGEGRMKVGEANLSKPNPCSFL